MKALGYIEEGLAILSGVGRTTKGWEDAHYKLKCALVVVYAGGRDRSSAFEVLSQLINSLDDIGEKLWPYDAELTLARNREFLGTYQGALLLWEGEYDLAQRVAEQVLESIEGPSRCFSLCVLAEILWIQGNLQQAKHVALDALQTSRQEAALHWFAVALKQLGSIETELGELAQARDHLNQSAAVWRAVGYPGDIASVLACLGQVEMNLGRPARAAELHQQALKLSKHYGNNRGAEAHALVGLGQAAAGMHDLQQATDCFRRALQTPSCQAIDTMEAIASTADIIRLKGDPIHAAALLAFVAAHPYTPHWVRVSAGKLLAELRAELPEDVYATATARGRARELTDVVAQIVGGADSGSGRGLSGLSAAGCECQS